MSQTTRTPTEPPANPDADATAPAAQASPALGLRARKRARTHEAIAEAAVTLFLERGFDETTVDDIAAAADVSPRTFFRYFASKEDALFVRFPEQVDRFVALLDARPDDEPLVDALRSAAHDLLDDESVDADLAHRAMALIVGHPALHATYLSWLERIEAAVAVWSARRLGVDPGDLRPRLLAATALTARRVAVDRWLAGGMTEDLDALMQEALLLLSEGVGHFDAPDQR